MVLGYVGAGGDVPAGWGILKTFLKKWHEQGSPGISPSAYKVAMTVSTVRSSVKTDQALLTLCPISGPFSAMEREAFHKVYNEAFAQGQLTEAEYIALTLERAFGARPAQLALMKLKDLDALPTNGGFEYLLSIPSAKKAEKSRVRFKKRLLVPELGELMLSYADNVAERHAGKGLSAASFPCSPWKR